MRSSAYSVTPETIHVGVDPNVVVSTLVSLPGGPDGKGEGTSLMVVVSVVTDTVPLSVTV